MQYDVRALTTEHSIVQLTVEACDESDVRRQMELRGLYAADIAPARAALAKGLRLRRVRRTRVSLSLFTQELLALLNAGLSIVECLEALVEKESNPASSQMLSRLLGALRDGKRFSGALAEQEDLFPPLYISIVRAAEDTSDLPQALSRYIAYQQRIDSVRGKLVSASIYPLILLVVGGAVSAFLIGYVVPRFAEVYQGAGRSLPWLSQVLLNWGQFVTNHGKALPAVAFIAAILLYLGARRLLARGGIAYLLTRVPGIGERVRIVELSRLYLTLGMLLEGGISIVGAMDTVQGMMTADLRVNLMAARQKVQSGLALSTAFDAHGLSTPISLRMLRVGERSGELGQMLTQSAAFYDGEIGRWIDRFMRMFEPLLMAAIGLIVGAIVVLLYMPIFDLAGGLT
ncbi:type II secretion system F family protein [Paraburkholderia caribensis]|uniref:Type II secretion system F family protein n=1 Tax=Paraburkholderia caribensis TaxID=75105 RepID=A0A9Q6S366_9BURK|nr:type II secretion system F family protein [Paraburkholderia caribensis]MCO4876595.1 type II secretion system F family protein [Paraburkholderia caribensis]QLB63269.1 type II secretion system protein [Paraburkholderia caribensis]